jgi:hypothetical protein
MSSLHNRPVSIRPARAGDSAGIRRLAALDSAPVPRGPLLLAEVDGCLLAAMSLPDGRAIADPFARTVTLVDMLRAAAGPQPRASR